MLNRDEIMEITELIITEKIKDEEESNDIEENNSLPLKKIFL